MEAAAKPLVPDGVNPITLQTFPRCKQTLGYKNLGIMYWITGYHMCSVVLCKFFRRGYLSQKVVVISKRFVHRTLGLGLAHNLRAQVATELLSWLLTTAPTLFPTLINLPPPDFCLYLGWLPELAGWLAIMRRSRPRSKYSTSKFRTGLWPYASIVDLYSK